MPDLKRRVITGIVGLALTLALAGCDADDSPFDTAPGDTGTTAPVGS